MNCCIEFEYPYRWDQILAASSPREQIQLLESNMTALESAVTASGGCVLEFPYRWDQFWEGLLAGEGWAIACAEENDRAIEYRFGRCTCAELSTFTVFCSLGTTPDPDAVVASETYTLLSDVTEIRIQEKLATGMFAFSADNYVQLISEPPGGGTPTILFSNTEADGVSVGYPASTISVSLPSGSILYGRLKNVATSDSGNDAPTFEYDAVSGFNDSLLYIV